MSVQLMEIPTLQAVKTSDTIVVLGSGPSINNLNDHFWQAIEQYDTLAINNWIYHSFVPTFWSLESIGQKRFLTAVFDAWQVQMQERNKDLYKDVVWLVENNYQPGTVRLLEHIGLTHAKIFSYVLYCIRDKMQWLRFMRNDKVFFTHAKRIFCQIIGDSLIRVLTVIYELGYKKIVLVGVDLYNSLYFWSNYNTTVHTRFNCGMERYNDDKQYQLTCEQANRKLHDTMLYRFNIVDAIADFNEEILKKNDVQLCVTDKQSCLYPIIQYVNIRI